MHTNTTSPGGWPLLSLLALGSLCTVRGEAALVAFVVLGRLLPLVPEVVAGKGLRMTEAHFAFRALEWALPCVDSQMSQQILLQAEALPTLRTLEVPLCPGDIPVLLCISPFVELLPGPA